MIMNDLSLFRWCWKSVIFNVLWRHKLQWHHICNRLIRVCKGCKFHQCIDCEKYCGLICRGRKLLRWPSYHTFSIFLTDIRYLSYAFKLHSTHNTQYFTKRTPFCFFHNLLKLWAIYMTFLPVVAEEILIQNIKTKYGSWLDILC